MAALLSLSSLSINVSAQAAVRNSSSISPSVAEPVAVSANTGVVYELQALQQEVQELRGQLEQQNYELKRLQQQRLDDYLDLDKRVSELARQQSSPVSSVTSSAPQPVSVSTGLPATVINTTITLDSKQSNAHYSDAIDLLLDKQDYAGAQKKFSVYLQQYPNGKFTPNVYYWQGQILFAGAKKEEASRVFEKLIAQYPTHIKVPDAKFKLARIYFDQGKKKEAKVILDDVAASGTDVAPLAKSFINKSY
ncbi:MAG: tol-pal system protein YbgF [Kiritimatiellia bacterium]|jgi:tol-pal system protein YbgF